LWAGALIALTFVTWSLLRASHARNPEPGTPATSAAGRPPLHDDVRIVSPQERLDAIARAGVWRQPAVPIGRARMGNDAETPARVDCWFTVTELGGTTPKFDCALHTTERIRVKYGYGLEIPAEVAASRLLQALGFGADTMTLAQRLRCHGCPVEPYVTMKVVEVARAASLFERVYNRRRQEDFEWVALERKFPARPIEAIGEPGWAMFELDRVDPSTGGAPRVHVDALRLMAVFLAHWDNKAQNQRMVCLSDAWREGTPCPEPFLLLHDVGATFGPRKVDLEGWEQAPLWEDRAACTVSMRELPFDGSTFAPVRITEGGRRFLGDLLAQVTDAQIEQLFAEARFDRPRSPLAATAPVSEWVRVFKAKVSSIREGPTCPEP
jgi:hypothetical protein